MLFVVVGKLPQALSPKLQNPKPQGLQAVVPTPKWQVDQDLHKTPKTAVKFGNILGLIIRYMFSFVLNSLGAPEVCPDLLACWWSNHPGYGKGHVQGLQ